MRKCISGELPSIDGISFRHCKDDDNANMEKGGAGKEVDDALKEELERSTMRAEDLETKLSATQQELEKQKRESQEKHESQEMLFYPLEAMRKEYKGFMLSAADAMIDADLPKRLKNDSDVPYYYSKDSWKNQQIVPWNEQEKRPLLPAEGMALLQEALLKERANHRETRQKCRELQGSSGSSR